MSDIGISPEDRERLAKQKFGEFLDEMFEERYNKAREKRLASNRQPRQQHQESSQSAPQNNDQPPPRRRRSLLEECLSQSLGWG